MVRNRHLSIRPATACALAGWLLVPMAVPSLGAADDPRFDETHRQVQSIRVTEDGKPGLIQTICADREGRVLVACGGSKVVYSVTKDGRQAQTVQQNTGIRVYSPAGELVASWPLDFMPEVVNVAPDGAVYVAGGGRIHRLDAEGKVALAVPIPTAGDPEAMEAAARKEQEERFAQNRERYTKMIGDYQAKEATLSAKEQRSAAENAELKKTQTMRQNLERTLAALGQARGNVAALVARKLKVPGLAIADHDVFVVCAAEKGYGYDVWRMTRDLEEPKKIVSDLRGCCGQMDVQTHDGQLFVAENGRHHVVRYDRNGEQLGAFGERAREGVEGFGGCCNPMNLRFTSDGGLLTAESEGRIKRYSPEGELLGVVGTAKLKGGCKHVAIAASPNLDYVFMLDLNNSEIAVLVPAAGESKPTTRRRLTP